MSHQGMKLEHVAGLARLELTPEEQARLGPQLAQILDYVEQLKEVDVSRVEPMAHAAPRVNVMRPDTVRVGLAQEEALRNAPAQADGLFVVPKIVE